MPAQHFLFGVVPGSELLVSPLLVWAVPLESDILMNAQSRVIYRYIDDSNAQNTWHASTGCGQGISQAFPRQPLPSSSIADHCCANCPLFTIIAIVIAGMSVETPQQDTSTPETSSILHLRHTGLSTLAAHVSRAPYNNSCHQNFAVTHS